MEDGIGIALALAVSGLAALVGFDRDRVFDPTVLIASASYYVLFAVIVVPPRRCCSIGWDDGVRSSGGARLQTDHERREPPSKHRAIISDEPNALRRLEITCRA